MPQLLKLKRKNGLSASEQINPLSNAVSVTHSFSPAVRGPGGLCGLSPPRAAGGLSPGSREDPQLGRGVVCSRWTWPLRGMASLLSL